MALSRKKGGYQPSNVPKKERADAKPNYSHDTLSPQAMKRHKQDRIIELLEQQNELLSGIAAAEITNAQATEKLMSSLLDEGKRTGSGYFNQKLAGGEGNRQARSENLRGNFKGG